MISNVISSLFQMMATCYDDDVVTITHMMESADDTITKHSFVTQSITVYEERVSSLLIIGYHSFTDRLHWLALEFVQGLSIHPLPL